MGPFKCRFQRDTPVKQKLTKRKRKRTFFVFETLKEESEGEVSTDRTETKVSHSSVTLSNSKPNPSTPGSNESQLTAPSRILLTPDPRAEEPRMDDQDPASSPSDGTETSSSDHDDSGTSDSVTADSLPSPEIFRGEDDASDSYVEDHLPALYCHVQNSTLLDVSLARDIHVHPLPNISNITDASIVYAEDLSANEEHEKDSELFQSGEASEFGTPPKVTRKVLRFKKVCASGSVAAKRMAQPADAVSTLSGMNSTSDTVDFCVAPERLGSDLKRGPVLFDFPSEAELEQFFQRSEERCAGLRSLTLFPLFVPDSPPG